MAKKKVTHPSQSQSNDDHKTVEPTPPMDDPSVQIQNLKNLNSVLLKETTQHRQHIESLLHAKHLLQSALDDRSAMDAQALISEKNLALELEKGVLFVFAETQMSEMGFRLVGERNERERQVAVLKGQVDDLTSRLDNERVLLSTLREEREQMKAEAENREREVEKLRLGSEKLREEKCEKERTIEELGKERDLAVRSCHELEKVVEELTEKIDGVTREKNETDVVNNAQGMKVFHLELDLKQLSELLTNSRNEEALMRATILQLEGSLGLAVERQEEMAIKNSELLREKKETEKTVEVLNEERDSICRVLDMVQKELENRQLELDEANRARDEIEKVRVSHENDIVELQGETDRLRGVVDNLEECCREFEEKNEQLLSQVNHYRNAVDDVVLEKDNIRKGFDEVKNEVEKLELQVAGMEEKIEQAEAELGQVRSEKENINERNKELESHVDVLTKEKDALQGSLVEAQRESADLRAKIEFSRINSNKALEMLRSTAALVSKDGAEEVVPNEKKPGEEIQPYAQELDAIRKAFKTKNEMVDEMKQQLVSLHKSVAEAHKGKSLWTAISSATTIVAAALTAYVARGR